jgi:Domain of Unknown Function (DUF1080)
MITKHARLLTLLPTLLVGGETISLFNGKNLDGWTMDVPARDKLSEANDMPIKDGILTFDTRKGSWWNATPQSFILREGLLVSLGRPPGHLITKESYSNYKLVVEYRFPKEPGNCGVLVHASQPRRLYDMFPQSVEVQMMHENAGDFWCIGENIEVPEMEQRRPRKEPTQRFGGDAPDARRIINLTDGSEKPLGEWDTMQIECKGDEIIVHVNGILVNHGSKSTTTAGKIAIQAEGAEVEFRKIELTKLP